MPRVKPPPPVLGKSWPTLLALRVSSWLGVPKEGKGRHLTTARGTTLPPVFHQGFFNYRSACCVALRVLGFCRPFPPRLCWTGSAWWVVRSARRLHATGCSFTGTKSRLEGLLRHEPQGSFPQHALSLRAA